MLGSCSGCGSGACGLGRGDMAAVAVGVASLGRPLARPLLAVEEPADPAPAVGEDSAEEAVDAREAKAMVAASIRFWGKWRTPMPNAGGSSSSVPRPRAEGVPPERATPRPM